MGPHRLELTKLLIEKGSDVCALTDSGSSILYSACESEDADPEIVSLLLKKNIKVLNHPRKGQTLKWRIIYRIAKCATSLGVASSLLQFLTQSEGMTPLHAAITRGDMAIVNLLLESGASPFGVDRFYLFVPELRGVLEKNQRKLLIRGKSKMNKPIETLGKRISTATPLKYDMWLVSLDTLLMLYGSEGKGRVMEVYQELKRRGFLTRWQDVPNDAEIIFVSHEWLSWAHPDPEGKQLRVLCRVLERLKEGELDTEMDPFHTLIFKHKFTTKGKDWKAMLKRTYLWVDWFSMPQPGAEKEDKIGKEAMATLRAEGSRAIRSIPAYVERSDFIMILVPGCHHSDRKVPTCYRTWRRRGWCLLELYAAAMARDSSNPPLLVRSERGTPMWMSPLETLKLSIGMADFTCCQRNHVITTETQKIMSGGKVKKIPCDKPIAGGILEQLINAKTNHLFNTQEDLVMARFHFALKQFWMRGLKEQESFVADKNKSAVEKFKKKLRWKDDESWFDCGSIGIVMYAILSDEPNVVRELLEELKQNFKGAEYTRRLESRVRNKGYVALGILGGTTTLMTAMAAASSEIVLMLLECGANVDNVDVMGNDAFMFSSIFGRSKNLECWLQRVKDWDLNRQNTVLGGCALGHAVYMGANKLETVKVLLNAGARLDFRTFAGGTILTGAVENEDSDPEVVRLILEKLKSSSNSKTFTSLVNYQKKSSTLKWKSIYFIAKALYRTGISKTELMISLAISAGSTPLNLAVIRGDVEIVKLLLENGANPYVENDLGMNAFDVCDTVGPFPKVRSALLSKSASE